MPEEGNSKVPTNPMEFWEQWYETTSKAWSQSMNGSQEAYPDPFGISQTLMKSLGTAQEQMQEQLTAGSFGMLDPREVWKRWFETSTDIWEKASGKELDPLGLTTQWLEMMEDARARMLAGVDIPADPISLMKQWYDSISETWATMLGNIIGSEKFMEISSRYLESYASFYKTFRRANEEFFSNLQLPTRSDIARVAELVIAVEDKVEKIEDTIEDFEDNYTKVLPDNLEGRLEQIERKLDTFSSSLQRLTTAEALEMRLDRVESKLDKLLVALTKIEAKELPDSSKSTNSTHSKAQVAKSKSSKDQALPVEAKSI